VAKLTFVFLDLPYLQNSDVIRRPVHPRYCVVWIDPTRGLRDDVWHRARKIEDNLGLFGTLRVAYHNGLHIIRSARCLNYCSFELPSLAPTIWLQEVGLHPARVVDEPH